MAVEKFHRLSYAAISGVAGAQSVLFAKSLVIVVVSWFNYGFKANLSMILIIMAMVLSIFLQVRDARGGQDFDLH